jgi:hypothetical protein
MSDITVPPRKRRRPALSCVECRRRKTKCDRGMPCGHCVQLKVAICTYPDTHANIATRPNVAKTSPSSLPFNNHHISPEVPRSTSLVQFSEPDPLSRSPYCLVDDGSHSHSETGSFGSTPVCTTDDSSSGKSVQNLVNRDRNLEQAEFSPTPRNKDTDKIMSILDVNISSFGDVMLQVGGNHLVSRPKVSKQGNSTAIKVRKSDSEKTQFFGRSHWMNTFNMVCQYI